MPSRFCPKTYSFSLMIIFFFENVGFWAEKCRFYKFIWFSRIPSGGWNWASGHRHPATGLCSDCKLESWKFACLRFEPRILVTRQRDRILFFSVCKNSYGFVKIALWYGNKYPSFSSVKIAVAPLLQREQSINSLWKAKRSSVNLLLQPSKNSYFVKIPGGPEINGTARKKWPKC